MRVGERAIRRKVVEDSVRSPGAATAPALGEPVAGFAVGTASCSAAAPGAFSAPTCVPPAPTAAPAMGMPTFPGAMGAGWMPPFPCPPPPAFMLFMMQQHMQRMQQMAMTMGWPNGTMPGMPSFPSLPPLPGSFPAMPCMPGAPQFPGMCMPGVGAVQGDSSKGMPFPTPAAFNPTGTGMPFPPSFPAAPTKGMPAANDHVSTHSGSGATTDPSDSGNSHGTLLDDCTDTEFHTFISSFLQSGHDDNVVPTGDPVVRANSLFSTLLHCLPHPSAGSLPLRTQECRERIGATLGLVNICSWCVCVCVCVRVCSWTCRWTSTSWSLPTARPPRPHTAARCWDPSWTP